MQILAILKFRADPWQMSFRQNLTLREESIIKTSNTWTRRKTTLRSLTSPTKRNTADGTMRSPNDSGNVALSIPRAHALNSEIRVVLT